MNKLAISAVLIAILAVPAIGQAGKADGPGKAPGGLTLDLGTVPADDRVVAESASAPAPPSATPAPPVEVFTLPRVGSVPTTTASRALFTLDTPIERLIADSRAKAVLDKVLPGLSKDENLPRFQRLSLRAFQPLTGGQLTDVLMKQAEADLATIGPAPVGKGRNAAR